jgi:NodT family efflux transporter outer membrane factor (OMF) lipoprotein
MTPRPNLVFAASITLLLTACSVGPDYHRPDAPQSGTGAEGTWKEGANWRTAAPHDTAERGAWWTVLQDPELDRLEQQVAISNQNLQAAEAAWRQATAALAGARSGSAPTIGADASARRSGAGPMSFRDATNHGGSDLTTDHVAVEGTAAWTPDLWGRIRRTVESGTATAQASAADLAGARLSAQAALATLYVQLRAADEQLRLLRSTATANERALTIARNQHQAGLVSNADVLQAEAQVAGVRAQIIALGVPRAQAEHAIAVLIGQPPSALTIAPREGLPSLPEVPLLVPSALLERRPDIAAAERRMAAANAQIGVAQAAYYPDLTLSGSIGYGGASAGSLLLAPNLLWSVGGELAATLFDGGARDAKVEGARAAWDQAVALYRQAVLGAFQQVEDELAAGRILGEQAVLQDQAQAAADEAARVSLNQYQAGTISYTAVIIAQNVATNDRIAALQVQSDRLTSAISLITALGGGWDGQLAISSPPPK